MKVEPNAIAREAASVFFQQFQAFLDAGFTEDQALKLLSYMINASKDEDS